MTIDAMTILERLRDLSIEITVSGDCLRLKPGSRVTPDLIEALRKYKAEVLAILKERQSGQPSLADELERMLALGARLKRGEIAAVRCGKTGRQCTACQGVPCLGSVPWTDAPEQTESPPGEVR